MITRGWCDAPSAPPSPLLRWCAMGSTNRERLTSALTDGRATRVVMRLGVAIELIIGFTLLVIPDVVIRALIAADGGTTSTIVGRVLGGALIGLGIAGASARGQTPERRIPTTRGADRLPVLVRRARAVRHRHRRPAPSAVHHAAARRSRRAEGPNASPRRAVRIGFLSLFASLVILIALLDLGAGPETIEENEQSRLGRLACLACGFGDIRLAGVCVANGSEPRPPPSRYRLARTEWPN